MIINYKTPISFIMMFSILLVSVNIAMAAQPTDTEEPPPRTTPTVQHGISPNLVIQIRAGIDENNCKDTEQGCFDFVPENATVNLGEKVMIINKNDRLHDLRNCPYTPDGANMIWCNVHDIFGSGHLPPGHSSTWTANKAGNITLYDAYTNVQGTYTVVDPNANDDTDETSNENKGNENTCKDKVKKQKQLKNKWKKVYNECSFKLEGAYDAWNATRHKLLSINGTLQDLESKYNDLYQRYNDTVRQLETANSTISNLTRQLDATSESDLQVRYNILESQYNETISMLNDRNFTIEKLKQELAEAKKKIEELESNDDETSSSNTESDSLQQSVHVIETIYLPDFMSLDNTGRTIDLYAYDSNKIRIDTYYADIGTRYYINDKVDITMYRDTEITNVQYKSTGQDPYCYVGDVISTDTSIHIQFRQDDDIIRCDNAATMSLNHILELDKEIYVRFANTENVPKYNNIPVPQCTTINFDDDNNELIENTKICYGKNGNDIILVSKILATFSI